MGSDSRRSNRDSRSSNSNGRSSNSNSGNCGRGDDVTRDADMGISISIGISFSIGFSLDKVKAGGSSNLVIGIGMMAVEVCGSGDNDGFDDYHED